MKNPKNEFAPLRPVGLAFAAVVAGIGPAKADAAPSQHAGAPVEPAAQSNTYRWDPTNHPGFEEDPSFVVEASEPVAPFSTPKKKQGELFD